MAAPPLPHGLASRIPGMRPGAIRWNVLVGLLYLVLFLVAVDVLLAVLLG